MINMKYTSKDKTFIMFRGIILGFYWELMYTLFKIPLFKYYESYIIVLYMVITLIIYFFILKSKSRYRAFFSWLSSFPARYILRYIFFSLPFGKMFNEYVYRDYWDEWNMRYSFPIMFDSNIIIPYALYPIITLLVAILAIIFSVPKKKKY